MRIRMPLDRAILHDIGGLPILCPAIVLLFKAKIAGPKDEEDFQQVAGAFGVVSSGVA